MTDRDRGYAEGCYLTHITEAQRHKREAQHWWGILKSQYPESHFVSGGKHGK